MSSDAVLQLVLGLDQKGDLREEVAEVAVTTLSPSVDNLNGMQSDDALLQAVARGSKEALALLFRRHARSVFNVALRILRDVSEADDLRQEVFLYVFEKAKLFRADKGSAFSWIVQITYHRAFDRRRYLARRNHDHIEDFEAAGSGPFTNVSLIEEIDARTILSRVRADLTEDQEQTLELHFFEGYSLREIAEKRGQSVGNIRNHYYRALERIRIHLFAKNRR